MAAPTINDTRPYAGYKRNEPFQFTLAASPLPLRWGAVVLPPGITVDDPADLACTGVAATDVITTGTAHGLAVGDPVYFTALTGGDGLVINTVYYVVAAATTTTCKVAATKGGAAIDITVELSAGVMRRVSTGVFSSTGIAINTQYLLNVWAENADGRTYATVPVCISPDLYVAPASGSVEEAGIPLTIDVKTRAVRLGLPGGVAATTSQTEALMTLIQNDTAMLVVYYEREGVQIDPDPSDLAVGVKDIDFNPALVIDSDFEKVGTGATARFYLPIVFNGDLLADALLRYQTDSGATFAARFEIQWKQELTFKGSPYELTLTTQKFLVQVSGEIIPN